MIDLITEWPGKAARARRARCCHAVGADQVGGAVPGGGPVGGPGGDLDAAGVLRQADHLDARQDRHAQLVDAPAQHPLGLVLRRDQQRAELGRQGAQVEPHPVEQAQLRTVGAGLGQLVGEARISSCSMERACTGEGSVMFDSWARRSRR